MKLKALFSSAILSLTLAQGATAALINNGDTTFDTSNGLSWLDLTESLSLRPADILAGDGGFLADGWSIATGAQVDYLFEQAGATAPGSDFHFYPDSTIPDLLLSLLGRTAFSLGGGEFGQGWATNGGDEFSLPAYSIEINPNIPITTYTTVGSSNVFDPLNIGSLPTIGVYLVKPVPLPATIWGLALALTVLVGFRAKSSHSVGVG